MNDNPQTPPLGSAAQPKPTRRTCRLAIVSFGLGIFSFPLLFGVAFTLLAAFDRPGPHPSKILIGAWLVFAANAVSAIATGFLARRRIKANPSLSGKGWAWTGSIIGCVMLLWFGFSTYTAVSALPKASLNRCIKNLRIIDGCKEQWALENKKTATDTPTWDDLIGTDKYTKGPMFYCPAGGTYTLGSMSESPRCSDLNHALWFLGDPRSDCLSSLVLFHIAKQQWLSRNPGKGPPTEADLRVYMAQVHGSITTNFQFKCRAGGKFIIGNLHEAPRCSIPGHTLK